ncbi:MAG: L7Ae/L30e/S12e/Gadd45 family ribosomal protein [Bacillota bacterium]|nr:L7Ae/L30e/S12e/Gadd45 family ribosomal protein [Bacillota bacterium]
MRIEPERVITMLGFAQKAGKIFSGEATVEAKVGKRGASLLITATDAPEETKMKMKRLANKHGIPFYLFGEKMELGIAIGKSPRNTVLVMDAGFAGTLEKYLKS